MADELVAMGFGAPQVETALAQAEGSRDRALELLLLGGDESDAGGDVEGELARVRTVGGDLPDAVLGELWVLDLDARALRLYLQQHGVAMPESTPFAELQSEAVDLVSRLSRLGAALEPEPNAEPEPEVRCEPEPQPEPDVPAEGVPPASVVDAVPQVLADRRAAAWPSGGPVALDLKALARKLPRASDEPWNDVAWAQLLEKSVTTASEMSAQPALLTLLVGALHIVDRQEQKLEASVAGVAEETERSERLIQAERDVRFAREHR